jgi:hypothetical protein
MSTAARPLDVGTDTVPHVSLARRAPVPVIAGLVTFIAVVLAIGPWPVGIFQDDGIYVILAKSLATGEGYRYLNLPGAPNATHFPPGYPALLALLWKISPAFPGNVALFKFANAALLGIAAAAACRFAIARLALGRVVALVTVLLFTVCAHVLVLGVTVMSEPLFLVLLFASLLCAERAVDEPSLRNVLAATIVAALLTYVRTLGVLVIPAVVLVLLARRRWRAAFTATAVAALVMLPWQLWVRAHANEVPGVFSGKYGDYAGWLVEAMRTDGARFVAATVRQNLRSLASLGVDYSSTGGLHPAIQHTALGVMVLLLVAGSIRLAVRAPVAASFLMSYLGVVLIWPFYPARFLAAIWPLMGMAFVLGGLWLATARPASWSPRIPRAVRALPAALLLIGYLTFNWAPEAEKEWDEFQRGPTARATPTVEWVAKHTSPNAVIATDDDALIHLYTGRRTFPIGRFTPQEYITPQTPAFAVASLREILRTYRADFMLTSTEYGIYAAHGLLTADPPELAAVSVLSLGAVFSPVGKEAP